MDDISRTDNANHEHAHTKAIKGFDKNLACTPNGTPYQFEIGKTYIHDGKVKACRSGFHAVVGHPLAVFGFYAPAGNRFAFVEQSGRIDIDNDGVKAASEIIKIGQELGYKDMTEEAVAWVTARVDWSNAARVEEDGKGATATGYQSASTATGYQSASTATGDQSASTATGDQSASTATGDQSASTATGYQSASTATGYQSASTATGNRSASTATGDQSASTALGPNGCAMATGFYGKAKAADGCAIFLVRRRDDYSELRGEILHVWCGIAGRDGVKPDTFYSLDESGYPIEAEGGE